MGIRRSIAIVAFAATAASLTMAQQPAAPAGGTDHVTAIKQALGQSAAALRQYQWVETTAVSIKGEEKSRTQNNCYYGADGKLQKTPIAAAPAGDSKKQRGLKGRAAENKREDVSESTQEAVGLVKQYVPPDPARIQVAKDAGKLSVTQPDPQGRVQVVIKDYLKAGDSLTIDLNATTNVISGVTVATFTDSAKAAVGLKVTFGSLSDGTIYAAAIHLDVAAQNLAVAIENTGHKKVGG